jgi:NADH-quinone oxidoreductase subunit N
MLMLPEILVAATALLVLVLELFLPPARRSLVIPLSALGLVAAGAVLAAQFGAVPATMLGGRYAVDHVALWFKLVFVGATLLTVGLSVDALIGGEKMRLPARLASPAEYLAVMLFALAGAMYLISARDLVSLYVALETATIPLFGLAAWKRNDVTAEAGLKYVVLAAFSSALLLFGLSLIFGLTGTTDFAAIRASLVAQDAGSNPGLWLAGALLLAGIGFKLTLVPFHLWAADVYQGAPTQVTAYLSVASKAAGLALLFQLFYQVRGHHLAEWAWPLGILAALTMTLGNLAAIPQHNIKRFMAFSAISQAGYVILGFMSTGGESVPAMVYYLVVYVLTNLAAFAVIVAVKNATGRLRIEQYCGLARSNPILALAMMIALFSLAGIPPLSGFVGKFFLFSIASEAGMHWLVAVAALNSTVSLYYYLRIVRQMYIVPLPEGWGPVRVSPTLVAVLIVTTLATVLLGIVPGAYEGIHGHTTHWLATLLQQ